MLNVVTAKQMQAIDRWAIEELGIPGAVLMENAGGAIVRQLQTSLPIYLQKKSLFSAVKEIMEGMGL